MNNRERGGKLKRTTTVAFVAMISMLGSGASSQDSELLPGGSTVKINFGKLSVAIDGPRDLHGVYYTAEICAENALGTIKCAPLWNSAGYYGKPGHELPLNTGARLPGEWINSVAANVTPNLPNEKTPVKYFLRVIEKEYVLGLSGGTLAYGDSNLKSMVEAAAKDASRTAETKFDLRCTSFTRFGDIYDHKTAVSFSVVLRTPDKVSSQLKPPPDW